jgi:hypothetical protein
VLEIAQLRYASLNRGQSTEAANIPEDDSKLHARSQWKTAEFGRQRIWAEGQILQP